jgi:abortive infection bacteriophage resistance protein
MVQHILPINDSDTHEESTTCKCEPKVINENGNMIIVHNSFDGRELVEEFNSILEIKNRVQYDLIKNKCPLAFSELKKMYDNKDYGIYLNPGYNGILNYWESPNYGALAKEKWNDRNLYDFFDTYKYFPQITKADNDTVSFFYSYNDNGIEIFSDTIHGDRNVCESACFTALFYHLEKDLIKQ